jgi:arylsulfatase A-like enzyme
MAAMLSAMDDAIGRVLSTLTAKGVMENTLIFFISDNGGPTAVNGSLNTPFSGFKGQVMEGGIHVAYLMQWKSRIPGGRVIDAPVISLDVHATAVAAAGAQLAPEWKLDGVDLMPFIQGKQKSIPHDTLYWRYGGQAAIRRGDWKLRMMGGGSSPELFNLANDPGEAKDLSSDNKDKATELMNAWKGWNAGLCEPLWKGGDGGARMKKNRLGGAGKRGKGRDKAE